jgi:hypothetical protein
MLVHVGNERVVIGRCAEGIVVFSDPCTPKGFSHGRSSDRLRGSVPLAWFPIQYEHRTRDRWPRRGLHSAPSTTAAKSGLESELY